MSSIAERLKEYQKRRCRTLMSYDSRENGDLLDMNASDLNSVIRNTIEFLNPIAPLREAFVTIVRAISKKYAGSHNIMNRDGWDKINRLTEFFTFIAHLEQDICDDYIGPEKFRNTPGWSDITADERFLKRSERPFGWNHRNIEEDYRRTFDSFAIHPSNALTRSIDEYLENEDFQHLNVTRMLIDVAFYTQIVPHVYQTTCDWFVIGPKHNIYLEESDLKPQFRRMSFMLIAAIGIAFLINRYLGVAVAVGSFSLYGQEKRDLIIHKEKLHEIHEVLDSYKALDGGISVTCAKNAYSICRRNGVPVDRSVPKLIELLQLQEMKAGSISADCV